MRGEDLLFDPTDGKDPPRERDLPRHGKAAPQSRPGHGGEKRRGKGNPRGRTILRDGALGNVNVDVAVFREISGDPQRGILCPQERERSLRAFLHHVPEAAREHQVAFPLEDCDLDRQELSSHFGPRKTVRETGLHVAGEGVFQELHLAQVLLHVAS